MVALAAHGLSNDEIADAMVLSPATAKTHVSRAMIKLGARDRAQLVVFAYQTGLVAPAPPGRPRAVNLAVPDQLVPARAVGTAKDRRGSPRPLRATSGLQALDSDQQVPVSSVYYTLVV